MIVNIYARDIRAPKLEQTWTDLKEKLTEFSNSRGPYNPDDKRPRPSQARRNS